MNLYNGWLYYLAEGNVWRMNIDGSKCQKVLGGKQEYCGMYLTDGMAYLAYEQEPGSYCYTLLCGDIKKWDMKEIVSDLPFKGYTISGGWIYYRDQADGYFCKIRADGKGKKVRLSKMYINMPAVADGWIYGVTLQNSVYRIAVNGDRQETVCKFPVSYTISGMRLKDKKIYFYSSYEPGEQGMIGSMRLDGTDYRQLFTASEPGDYFQCLNFLDGEIVAAYCQVYRMTGTVSIDLKTGSHVTY